MELKKVAAEKDAALAEEYEDDVKSLVKMWVKMCGKSLTRMLSTLDDIFPNATVQTIDASASFPELQSCYRRALLIVHPDKQPEDSVLEQKLLASEVFQVLNLAFRKCKEKHEKSFEASAAEE